MDQMPACPKCKGEYVYHDSVNFVCPDCGNEWNGNEAVEADEDQLIVKDSNGNLLADGDDVLAGGHSNASLRSLLPAADGFPDPLFCLFQFFLHGIADHVGALCPHPVQLGKAHHVGQQGLEVVKAAVAVQNGAAGGGDVKQPVALAQAVGPAVLAIGKGEAADGDVLNVAAQQRRELILPIGRPHQNHVRSGKLPGIAEHGVVKLLGHLQLMALGQGVAVQGQQLLLVQTQFLHLGLGEAGSDLLQGCPAQTEGPGLLPADAAVDKQDLHFVLPFSTKFDEFIVPYNPSPCNSPPNAQNK